MEFQTGLEFAQKLDKIDPLKKFRRKFHIPVTENNNPTIYLCGNSLGLQPRKVRKDMLKELDSWKKHGVEGHFKETNWVSYHEELGKLAEQLFGAIDGEVVIMNTLTVNLHLMMVSFYQPTPTRFKILTEAKAFPSDQYAVKSQIAFHGYDPLEGHLELQASNPEGIISEKDFKEMFEKHGNEIALVMFSGVNYYSGQVYDIEKIVKLARKHGCMVGFDLAHAVGNVELKLHDWDVDFAVWCNYKYLNSGPGSIAGAFVHKKHHTNKDLHRFAGWWGHDKASRFAMGPEFVPIESAEAWQISNAPVFSMTPIKTSYEIFLEAGMSNLIKKSKLLTGYLQYLIEFLDSEKIWISPKDSKVRGCQISIHVKSHGKKLYDELTMAGVICDWREPDVIRIAPVPLYNTFEDVYRFYEILQTKLR